MIIGQLVFIGSLVANSFSVNLSMYMSFRMMYAVGFATQSIGAHVYC